MEVILPAWSESQGYLGLRAVLDAIGPNGWTWRLDEFHGTTRSGAGLSAVDLEAQLQAGQARTFDWNDLLDFADEVDQLIDGRLTAFAPGATEPTLTIEARDSTDWKVAATDGDATGASAVYRLAALNN